MINTNFRGALASATEGMRYPTTFDRIYPGRSVDLYQLAGDPYTQVAAIRREDGDFHLAVSLDGGVSYHATKFKQKIRNSDCLAEGVWNVSENVPKTDYVIKASLSLFPSFIDHTQRDARLSYSLVPNPGKVIYENLEDPPTIWGFFEKTASAQDVKSMSAYLYATQPTGRLYAEDYLETRFRRAAEMRASAVAHMMAPAKNPLQAAFLFWRAAEDLNSFGMNEPLLLRDSYRRARTIFALMQEPAWAEKIREKLDEAK